MAPPLLIKQAALKLNANNWKLLTEKTLNNPKILC